MVGLAFITTTRSYTYYEMPTIDNGVVFDDLIETAYSNNTIESIFEITFYDTTEDAELTFLNIFNFMDNVNSMSRIYITENPNQYYFVYSGSTIATNISMIFFHYSLSGSQYSYVRLFDSSGNLLSSYPMVAFDANTHIFRKISLETDYDLGFIEGMKQGIDKGKIQGQNDMQSYYENTVIPGVQTTYENIGYQDAYDEFYNARYQEGYSDGTGEGPALINYIPGILGVVMGFFFQIASIEFAGVSILDVVVALFGITVALLIFKIFLGGK